MLRLAYEFWWDFSRVLRYSSAVLTGNTRDKLAALITMGYHGIEKGLSLPRPRPGFGANEVQILIWRLDRYVRTFGFDELAAITVSVLRKYCEFNLKHEALQPDLSALVESLAQMAPSTADTLLSGGNRLVKREDFLRKAKIDLSDFFAARSSVRQFASQVVSLHDIESAVSLARMAPSCCNRQSSRVWVITDGNKIQTALRIQGGARGFAEEIRGLLVVTSDLACFQSAGERSQALIDGGMFAMSLLYSLQSLGLVTCSLNWSKKHKTDCEFRRAFPIPPQETIVLVIAVGHPKDEYPVAVSQRRHVSEVVKIL
jgi:nitroreductase